MRHSFALLTVLTLSLSPTAAAQPAVPEQDEPARGELLRSAQRDLELAEIRLRRFENVEFPLSLRKLQSRIRLLSAEVPVWERRIREYKDLDKFVGSSGVLITLDDARLTLLQVRTELEDLEHERRVVQDGYSDQRRLLALEVEVACERLKLLKREPPKVARR
jgi:hypothetical protein